MSQKIEWFSYIVGQRPTPMLAIYTDKNQDVFDKKYNQNYGYFSNQYNHIWNINAYIIYDKTNNEIISYKFDDFAYFIWLLRSINIELKIPFSIYFIQNNDETIKEYQDEIRKL